MIAQTHTPCSNLASPHPAGRRKQQNRQPKPRRVAAPGAHPEGTYTCWKWGWDRGKSYSALHALGHQLDGQGFRLTVCGALARPMPDSEKVMLDFTYGDAALVVAAEHGLSICVECYAHSAALNIFLRAPRMS
jgi:hypothetical protein